MLALVHTLTVERNGEGGINTKPVISIRDAPTDHRGTSRHGWFVPPRDGGADQGGSGDHLDGGHADGGGSGSAREDESSNSTTDALPEKDNDDDNDDVNDDDNEDGNDDEGSPDEHSGAEDESIDAPLSSPQGGERSIDGESTDRASAGGSAEDEARRVALAAAAAWGGDWSLDKPEDEQGWITPDNREAVVQTLGRREHSIEAAVRALADVLSPWHAVTCMVIMCSCRFPQSLAWLLLRFCF